MIINSYDDPVPSYSSYKAIKFEKHKMMAQKIVRGINDLSLKKRDKEKLVNIMIKELKDYVMNDRY